MVSVQAMACPFHSIMKNGEPLLYPYILSKSGDVTIHNISPCHGRSFIVGQRGQREFVVTKGNGLNYSSSTFLNTREMGDDTWGLLLRKDAERDFLLGNEISSLGIKTNKMEAVIELEADIELPTNKIVHPVLLQYTVECPYRIEDCAFMPQRTLWEEVMRWERLNERGYEMAYLIAADVLIHNLRILHDNNILHNAIHIGNYTWALELLDFELACSPKHPYENEDYQRHAVDLFEREIIHTYVVINYIAGCLQEVVDFKVLDKLFNRYGFDLNAYSVNIERKGPHNLQ